jgi:hypothetical protein
MKINKVIAITILSTTIITSSANAAGAGKQRPPLQEETIPTSSATGSSQSWYDSILELFGL